jgi:hypothetical protein
VQWRNLVRCKFSAQIGEVETGGGNETRRDPSTSVPSFLRAGGMTGLGKRREEFEI